MTALDALVATGVLRAAINLGNPVLAQGTHEDPSGVTIDLARDLGARAGARADLRCFDAARDAFGAVRDGHADVAFLAIDPDRAEEVAFTSPYAIIEGVYAVPRDSPVADAGGVDAAGLRIGVKRGSAYDLDLSRRLRAAAVVRGEEGTAVAAREGLEVAAGIRTPVTTWAEERGWRVLEPAFLQIRQAVAISARHDTGTIAAVASWLEERKADGFVEASLRRSGRTDARVAPAS